MRGKVSFRFSQYLSRNCHSYHLHESFVMKLFPPDPWCGLTSQLWQHITCVQKEKKKWEVSSTGEPFIQWLYAPERGRNGKHYFTIQSVGFSFHLLLPHRHPPHLLIKRTLYWAGHDSYVKDTCFSKTWLLNINYFICAQLKEQQSVLVLEE